MSTQPGRREVAQPGDPFELRGEPRVGSAHPVRIYATAFSGPLAGRTRDVSVTGCCIATPSVFDAKSIQRVRLDLPGGALELDAEGRWQRAFAHDDAVMTSVAFLDPPDEAVERLWDVVLDAGKQLARFLYRHSDLRDVGVDGAMGLAQVTRFREVKAGQALYRQGPADEDERSIFVVDRGRVTLQVRVRGARETALDRLGPGSLLGGLPLLAPVDHAESAVAETDARLLEIDARSFRYLARAKPWLAQLVAQAVTSTYARRLHGVLARVHDRL